MKHVIIGCGPAGIAAAETIRALSPPDEITIISDEAKPLYSRCLISYRLMVSEDIDISYRDEAFFDKLNATCLLGKKVIKISTQGKTVTLDDGREVSFDRLLIATGGTPKMPSIPGVGKEGVLGFRTTADLAKIRELLPATKNAAVLGGGCIGLQVASGLMAAGLKVAIIIRSPHLLSQVADEASGKIYGRIFSGNGAEVITGREVSSIEGGERVERIKLDNGQELDCDLVVIGKGVSPNTKAAKEAGITCGYGITVDNSMMTDAGDIFAAGDVAETIDCATREPTVNALWPCASEQGRIAGSNMAGVPKEYEGSLRMNAVEFFDIPMISVGVVKPTEDRYEVFSSGDEERNAYRKIVFEGDVLAGFIMIGDIDNAGVLTSLVRKRAKLGRVKEDLIAGRLAFSNILDAIRNNRDKFMEESYTETLISFEEKKA